MRKNHLVRVFIAVKINSFGYFRMKLQEMNFLWCLSLIMVKVGKSAIQAPHLEDDHSHTRFRRSQSRSQSPLCLDQWLGKRDLYAPVPLIKGYGDSGNEIENV